MNYTKPEIVVFGKVARVINFILLIKQQFILMDFIRMRASPAYDLDD